MAICSHLLASKATIDAIKVGGNAVDGICSAALMQTVVARYTKSKDGTPTTRRRLSKCWKCQPRSVGVGSQLFVVALLDRS